MWFIIQHHESDVLMIIIKAGTWIIRDCDGTKYDDLPTFAFPFLSITLYVLNQGWIEEY